MHFGLMFTKFTVSYIIYYSSSGKGPMTFYYVIIHKPPKVKRVYL